MPLNCLYTRSTFSFLFLTICVICNNNLFGQVLMPEIKPIPLGDDTVYLKMYTKKGYNIVYVHVHENEEAALEAGLKMIDKYGGKLVTLSHSKDGTKNRNVVFKYQNSSYRFDPNRIYTQDQEILKANILLEKGKKKVDDNVVKSVQNLAYEVWKETALFPTIIALHNNKNVAASYKTRWLFWKKVEPESFSILSYVKRFDASSTSNQSCSDIYINPTINNSEFFIVTQKRDFELLMQKRYNVVLQNENPVDDGSMSVYAFNQYKRYINVEAKMGRSMEQVKMLELFLEP